MIGMKQVLLALSSAVLLSGAGNYNAALGIGMKQCGAWTAARHGTGSESAAQWFLGFVSGLNVHSAPVAIMNDEGRGMLGKVDAYCAAHPKTNVMAAAAALVIREYDQRGDMLEKMLPHK